MIRILAFVFLGALAFGIYRLHDGPKGRARRARVVPSVVVVLAVSLLILAGAFGGNFPILDAWDDIYMFGAPFRIETLKLSSGGHVVVSSRILTYIVGNLTRFDFNALLILQWSGLATLGFLLSRLNRTEKESAWLAGTFAITSLNAGFVLDPRLLQHILAPVLFVAAILAFRSPAPYSRHVLASMFCAIATLNTAWGLVSWPAFFFPVLIEARKRPSVLLPWLIMGVGSGVLFITWFASGYGEQNYLTARALGFGVLDFFVLVGTYFYPARLLPHFYFAIITGVIALGFLVLLMRACILKHGFRSWLGSVPAMLSNYAIMGGLLATVGRGEFYPFASRDMRYNLVAAIFYSAIYAHLLMADLSEARRRFEALMIASFVVGFGFLVHSAKEARSLSAIVENCLRAPDPFADLSCYQRVFSDLDKPHRQDSFRKAVNFMKENRLGSYGRQ